MTKAKDTFRETDEEARDLAHKLLTTAQHGALGVLINGAPFVTRVALSTAENMITTLISDLAPHTQALRDTPQASLMIGEPGRGDPLAHPRMTLQVTAQFIEKTEGEVERYLKHQPKAALYIGFGDFHLVRLAPNAIHLNGGFGKAYRMSPNDLRLAT